MTMEEVTLTEHRHCDLCNLEMDRKKEIAKYDGKTEFGPWAYMCEGCFEKHGVGLGLGRGKG